MNETEIFAYKLITSVKCEYALSLQRPDVGIYIVKPHENNAEFTTGRV